ncbi:MAG: transposase family protein [Candidatus Xenobium sp.]|jgi:DNA-binding transcriptional MerR regulator
MSRRLPQDAGHGQKLTRKSEAAIGALLASSSISEAAKACGVAERTIRNWMTRPDFREAYDQARRQVLDQVLAHLQASSGEALETLLAVCRDQDARPAARVAAARAVLDLSVKIRSEEDFDARLRALEAQKEQTRENGMTWADVMRKAEEP